MRPFRFSIMLYFEKEENIARSLSGGSTIRWNGSRKILNEMGMMEKQFHWVGEDWIDKVHQVSRHS